MSLASNPKAAREAFNRRRNKELTRGELAVMLGVSRNTAYRVEIGKQTPTAAYVCRASKIFGVSMDDLHDDSHDPVAFGKLLRRRRKSRGWTQVELGVRVRLSGARISEIERGIRPPPMKTVRLVARELGIPV